MMGDRNPTPVTPFSSGGQQRVTSETGRASGATWQAAPGETAGHSQDPKEQALGAAKEKAGELAGQASTAVDDGIDRAASGLDTAADMLRDRGEQMGEGSGVQSSTAMVADRLDAAALYLRDKDSGQLIADLEALVRQKPTQSLLVAAGMGFLISKILR